MVAKRSLAGYGVMPGSTAARYFKDLGRLGTGLLGGGNELVKVEGALAELGRPEMKIVDDWAWLR